LLTISEALLAIFLLSSIDKPLAFLIPSEFAASDIDICAIAFLASFLALDLPEPYPPTAPAPAPAAPANNGFLFFFANAFVFFLQRL